MAMCKRTPRRPTAMEATAITAGPVMNLTPIANAAIVLPQAIILGCNAINNPAHIYECISSSTHNFSLPSINSRSLLPTN